MPQPKVEEELSGDKVLESDPEKMSHGFQLERDPCELPKAKPVEENGEQEAEPVRNGAESVSEGEGTEANSGFPDSSGEGPVYQYKPGKSCLGLLRACLGLCLPKGKAVCSPHGIKDVSSGVRKVLSILLASTTQQAQRHLWVSTRGRLFSSCWWE